MPWARSFCPFRACGEKLAKVQKKLIVEPLKKRKEKENEKGSLENYLAGDYRRTYCRRHYARRYQLHVNSLFACKEVKNLRNLSITDLFNH